MEGQKGKWLKRFINTIKSRNRTMEEEKDLGTSLIETVGKSELAKVIPDYLEIGLDSQLTEGIFRELPIISSSLAIYKTTLGIRDLILLKKIILFLKEASKIDEKERRDFLVKMSKDKKYQRRVGEQLLLYIDRLDNIEKSVLLARLFNGYIKREIEYDTFQRLAHILDKSFTTDITQLPSYYKNLDALTSDIGENLYRVGLVNLIHGLSGAIDFNKDPAGYTVTKYVPNEVGKKMVSLLS